MAFKANVDCLVNETYAKLHECFIGKGRGNRPKPPTDLRLTNRLLLQLRLLKEKENKNENELILWFTKLFPDVDFPAARVGRLVSRTYSCYQALEDTGEILSFLEQERDLDFVSDALSELGLTRKELMMTHKKSMFAVSVTNQVVLDIEQFRIQEKLPRSFIMDWLNHLDENIAIDVSDALQVRYEFRKIDQLKAECQRISKNHCQTDLATLLSSRYKPRCLPSTSSLPAVNRATAEATRVQQLMKENDKLKETSAFNRKYLHMIGEGLIEVTHENVNMRSQKSSLETKVTELEEVVLNMNATATQTAQSLQNLRREKKETKRKLQRAENKNTFLHEVLTERVEQLDDTMEQLDDTNEQLLHTQNQLDQEMRDNLQLHESLAEAEEGVLEDAHAIKRTRIRGECNRFTDSIRTTVLRLNGEAQVPAERISAVIKIVSENMFGVSYEKEDLPTAQTCINIIDEGRVLADVQTVERILDTENVTLHLDCTSRDQQKIIGHQVTLDSGESLSLGFSSIPQENATTLLDVTLQHLESISSMYADLTQSGKEEVFKELMSKVTSIMSDRAAVMKKFDEVFAEFLRSELGQDTVRSFLYCNAHFLLGLSRVVDSKLAEIEEGIAENLGRDGQPRFSNFRKTTESATARIIRTASDCAGPRGDAQSGCRQEWLAFCAKEGVKSHMTSYRGNRFNSIFEGAASLIHHRQLLRSFFDSLGHSNMKIESVLADLGDERLMDLVCAVGLLFLRVTGPYWKLLNSKVLYTDLYLYIQPLANAMERWSDDASELLQGEYTALFGDQFELGREDEAVRQSLFAFANKDEITTAVVKQILEQMMPKFVQVVKNQLGAFLAGGEFGGPPAPVPVGLDHVPLTNLLGEHVFGHLDYDMGRRRHTSLHQRSATHMLRHNSTAEWLRGKSQEDQAALLRFGRKKGRQLRHEHRTREKRVQERLQEIMQENIEMKFEKAARKEENQMILLEKVKSHGGPCKTPQDVASLVLRLRGKTIKARTEAVKNELRLRKCIVGAGKNLRLGGSFQQLTQQLKQDLAGPPTRRGRR